MEEEKEELTETDLMLKEMQEDSIVIETEDLKPDPMSNAYNVLDTFNPENATS